MSDTDPAPPPDGCPYPDGCGPLRKLGDIMARDHQEVMRAIEALREWEDRTEVREQRAHAVEQLFDARIAVLTESVERLAKAAGGSSGREAGAASARPAKWAGVSGAAAGVAAIVWELIRLAGH
jgi:hypothetical protein